MRRSDHGASALRSAPFAPRAARGVTLVELLVVLVIVAALASIAIPRLRDSSTTARGAALAGRVHAVELAFEGANEPRADSLTAEAGTVPVPLERALAADHFRGEAGVSLSIVGEGREVWLRLSASTPEARSTLASFEAVAKRPTIRANGVTLVPLSDAARTLAEAMRGGAGASGAAGAISDEQLSRAEALRTAQAAADSAAQANGDDDGAATPSSVAERSEKEAKEGGNPACAPTLPPEQYRACLRATSSGWLRP